MNYRVHKTTQIAEPPTQIHSISKVKVSRDTSGKITVAFSYNPLLVEKVKTIEGYKWHPDNKHWSFPDSDGILNKILKVFRERLSARFRNFWGIRMSVRP